MRRPHVALHGKVNTAQDCNAESFRVSQDRFLPSRPFCPCCCDSAGGGGGVGRFRFLSPACMSAVHVASPPPRPPESVVAGVGTGNVFQRHAAQLSPQCLIGRCASAVATATDRLGPCSRLQIARTPPLLFSPSSSTHTHAGGWRGK